MNNQASFIFNHFLHYQSQNERNILNGKLKSSLATASLIVCLIIFSGNQLKAQSSPSIGITSTSSSQPNNLHNSPLTTSPVLYSQLDNLSVFGFTVQNFETANDVNDCEGADDFVVPEGKTWSIDAVDIIFFTNFGAIPDPIGINIRFYSNDAGKPGTVLHQFINVDIPAADFNAGIIPLPSPVILNSGTYWFSLQASMDYSVYGQIYWCTQTVQNNNPAHWRNPLDGFASGFTDWTDLPTTGLNPSSMDLSFVLYGNEASAVPFPIIGSILAFLGIGLASFLGFRKKKKSIALK
ncbi:MAG TPA: hypothetical protein VJY41_01320 [Prolixibacteraceae bacterium]|nr:hypothetical protein [Prolixibacteraceae bacterium]